MYSLFIKEVKIFFNSLTGYLVIIAFLLLCNLIMWVFKGPMSIPNGGYATLDSLFTIAPWVLLILIPAVTMRSFSEEMHTGTLDVLLTRPLSVIQIILAKYLASLVLIMLALLPTLVSYFSVLALGDPPGNIDQGGTWGSYIGLIMLAASYTAIGLFCSSLTENIVVSFLLAALLSLFMCFGFEQLAAIFSMGRSGNFILSLGILEHYKSLSRGVVDTRDVIYFIALSIIFILATQTRMEWDKQSIITKKQVFMNLSKRLRKPVLFMAITLAAAYLLSIYFWRFDLTSEKRYTLSDYTKSTLRKLPGRISITVYLHGDLNIPFRKMEQSLHELLDEFSICAGNHLTYEFIDPFDGETAQAKEKMMNKLYNKGLRATNIINQEQGESTEKLVFPGALIAMKDTVPLNFLKTNPAVSAEENINRSIQAFEFELMRAITSLVADSTEKVAFTEGHGEFNEYQVRDLTEELGWYFQVDRGQINGTPGILDSYKAVIIAGPTQPFPEKDKLVIDQYLMQGGNLLWFVDMTNAMFDSLVNQGNMMAMIRILNIEDILFRYGVRINPMLVQDVQCNMIPVNVALAGNQPDFRPAPWLYSPLLQPSHDHPVSRNLNMVRSEFVSFIDTLAARRDIRKTVLLHTSEYSKKVTVPVMISLEEVRLVPQPVYFTDPFLPVSVMLEGCFESAFRYRQGSSAFADSARTFLELGSPAKMMVTADADIIRNDVRPTPQGMIVSPLGYDRYTRQTYGNKEFIVNALQYMTGHEELISLRSREISLRLLNKTRLKKHRNYWVILNTALPPLVVCLLGLIYHMVRKRKYGINPFPS
jgi:ABC-2 type transport system permease protein